MLQGIVDLERWTVVEYRNLINSDKHNRKLNNLIKYGGNS